VTDTNSTPRPQATASRRARSPDDRACAAFAQPDFIERCFDAYSVLLAEARGLARLNIAWDTLRLAGVPADHPGLT
jgi:hypothetical protein